MATIDAAIGHSEPGADCTGTIAAAKTYAEIERAVWSVRSPGPTDLMEFLRLDIGEVLAKGSDRETRPEALRLLVGTPHHVMPGA